MRKTIAVMAAASALAIATVSTPQPAQARCIGCAIGAGVAAGVIGGALIAGASRPYGYGYNPYPAYGYYSPCHWERRSYWNGWGWVVRPVRVCY